MMPTDTKNVAPHGGHPPSSNSQQSWPENVPIPESFLCALTKLLMKDPVIDREGNSYEKHEILVHLQQGKNKSPVTQNPLRESDLVDNKGLQMAIVAAKKIATDKEDKSSTNNRRKPRRMRIANPLTASMKKSHVLKQKMPTFRKPIGGSEGDTPEDRHDSNKSAPPKNDTLMKKAGSLDEANNQSEEKQNKKPPNFTEGKRITRQRAKPNPAVHDSINTTGDAGLSRQKAKPGVHDSINTGDKGLDANVAAFIQAGTMGTSFRTVSSMTSSKSQLAVTKEIRGHGGNDPLADSAEARFEARLRRKLSLESNASSAVYRRSTDYDERLSRKLSDYSVASKLESKGKASKPENQNGPQKAINGEQRAADAYSIANYVPKRKNETPYESNYDSATSEGHQARISKGAGDDESRRVSVDDIAVTDYKKENLRQSNESRISRDDSEIKISHRQHYKGERRSASMDEGRLSVHVSFANYLPKRKHEPDSAKDEPKAKPARRILRRQSTDDSALVDYKRESLRQSNESLTKHKSKDDSHIGFKKNTKSASSRHASKERKKTKKSTSKGGKARRQRRPSVDDMAVSDHKRETLRRSNKGPGQRNMSVDKKRSDADATFEERLARKKLERKNRKSRNRQPSKDRSSPNPDQIAPITSHENDLNNLEDGRDSPGEKAEYAQVQEERSRAHQSRRSRSKPKEKSAGTASKSDSKRSLLDEKVEQMKASMESIKDSATKEDSRGKSPGVHHSALSHLDSFEARIIAKNKEFSRDQTPLAKQTSLAKLNSFNAKIASKINQESRAEPSRAPERKIEKNFSKPCILTNLGLSERRLSELTMEEDNESCHGGSTSLDGKSSLSSGNNEGKRVLRRISSTGRISKPSDDILHRKIPTNNVAQGAGRDSYLSWGDLDGEIAKAQFLSMKVSSSDALKIQRELDAIMDEGFDAADEPKNERKDQTSGSLAQFSPKRRVSDLTNEEDNPYNHGMTDSLVQAAMSSKGNVQGKSEKSRNRSESPFTMRETGLIRETSGGDLNRKMPPTGLIRETSGGDLNRKMPPTTARAVVDHSESAISWGDLDGELAEATYLSMKVGSNDALRLQRQLEADMQTGIDASGPLPAAMNRGGGPPVTQRKPKARRGKNKKTRSSGSGTLSISDKADAIMPIVADTDKTRSDVLFALKAHDGDKEKAVGMLLGFGESFFSND